MTISLYEICQLCAQTSGATLQFSLIFLMKNKNENSILSSPSQTPNGLFFFLLLKAKLLGYIPCHSSNAGKLLFPVLAAFLRVSPCLSAGLGAALLLEIAQSWWIQAIGLLLWAKCREKSFSGSSLPVRYSLVSASQSIGPWGSSPEVGICFLRGHAPGDGRRKPQTQVSSSLCNHCRLL